MINRVICFVCLLLNTLTSAAQNEQPVIDSTAYYNDLFSELDDFLDSLTAPRTMFIANLGVSNRFLNYTSNNDFYLTAARKFTITPSVGYYHKNGMGISTSGTLLNDGEKMNLYQFIVSGSYDYLKSFDFMTGIALTRYITKDSLSFYTSPLKNEVSLYFVWKDSWFKPGVSATYGWGTRKDVEEREEYITALRLRPVGWTRIDSRESISDFSVMASVRHDFYWLKVAGNNSVLKLTPQLVFISGTQKFGFNQNSMTYADTRVNGVNVLTNSENIYLDDHLYFQPLSFAAIVKAELSLGKFYIQPQAMVDYYFPASENNFTTILSLNTGFVFSK